MPKRKVALLPHEKELLAAGKLTDATHANATAVWLHADSSSLAASEKESRALVYRHMGDVELNYLLAHDG